MTSGPDARTGLVVTPGKGLAARAAHHRTSETGGASVVRGTNPVASALPKSSAAMGPAGVGPTSTTIAERARCTAGHTASGSAVAAATTLVRARGASNTPHRWS